MVEANQWNQISGIKPVESNQWNSREVVDSVGLGEMCSKGIIIHAALAYRVASTIRHQFFHSSPSLDKVHSLDRENIHREDYSR